MWYNLLLVVLLALTITLVSLYLQGYFTIISKTLISTKVVYFDRPFTGGRSVGRKTIFLYKYTYQYGHEHYVKKHIID